VKTVNIKFRKFDWLNDMQGSWNKIIFLSIVLVVTSLFFISANDDANAQEKVVVVKSIGFDKTTIIEFTNNGTIDIQTFRLWLGSDFSFESFKAQDSWTGKKTPQGVLIFTTDSSLKPGESVKFGLETDNEKPGINWKALDENGEQIEIGKTLTSDLPHYEKQLPSETSSSEPVIGILDSSAFRIIPETPNVGSTIRVVGNGFVPNYTIDFYLDAEKLDSFQVPDSGNFVATAKIPSNEVAKRVDFFIKDGQGNEKFLSVRLGETKNRMAIIENIPFTIKNLPSVVHPGEVLKVSGSGLPGSSVTATINTPDGEILSSFVASVDTNGNWNNDYLVPLGIVFGQYTAEISDGRETKFVRWNIESSQSIQISPTKILFDPGSVMMFNGTAIPNQELEIVLENPQGSEIFSKVISIDNSGIVEFEIPTTFDDIDCTDLPSLSKKTV